MDCAGPNDVLDSPAHPGDTDFIPLLNDRLIRIRVGRHKEARSGDSGLDADQSIFDYDPDRVG
jgi:hypothetical protein